MTPGSWGRTPSTPTETRWLYLVPKLRSSTPQRAKEVAELDDTVARLAATVKEQAAQIQKVSAQVEVNKPAPQLVMNKP